MGMSNAKRLAKTILNGFDAFFGDFQNITLGGQARFERGDWHQVRVAMRLRLEMYKKKITSVAAQADAVAGGFLQQRSLWREAKLEYTLLLATHSNYEIAQTFYNSVYCYVFNHVKIRDAHSFVFTAAPAPKNLGGSSIYSEYRLEGDLAATIETILLDTQFNVAFENLGRDVARVVDSVRSALEYSSGEAVSLQVLNSLFYRNKAAYLVGRLQRNGEFIPFIVALLNNQQIEKIGGGQVSEKCSIYVDAVLTSTDDVSKLFSFTRSYFMVDAPVPSRCVDFLQSIVPHKEAFELYSAIGFGKHGKTVFFRSAVAHTLASKDQYIIAPGIKGMVMLVFTLPSYDYVYKVIKDRFTPPKDMSRDEVKAKYKLVKRWDRAGRMAETQEFNNLAFSRHRFSKSLLDELRREVPSLLQEKGNALILKHVYVERRMTPLNLYIKDASDEQLESAMDEYGNAIKQLAGANIFPGDMLLKNFGVTRHGRVVFYDYDEITPLVDCNFRAIPEPQTFEQEMASEPWYDVGLNDVFPEEFSLFFKGNRRAKQFFDTLHGDLYEMDFWKDLQRKIVDGKFQDVYPYRQRVRF